MAKRKADGTHVEASQSAGQTADSAGQTADVCLRDFLPGNWHKRFGVGGVADVQIKDGTLTYRTQVITCQVVAHAAVARMLRVSNLDTPDTLARCVQIAKQHDLIGNAEAKALSDLNAEANAAKHSIMSAGQTAEFSAPTQDASSSSEKKTL